MNKAILTVSVLPIAAAIAAFYYYEDQSMLLRVLGLLASLVVSALIAYQSASGKAAWAFVRESRTEIRKVVWPTRKETAQTTMFVIVAVIIMGIFFFFLDMLLGWAVRALTS